MPLEPKAYIGLTMIVLATLFLNDWVAFTVVITGFILIFKN